MSASVAPAPIVSPSMRRSRKSRPMSASISNCLRLSFGYRSVPPATNIALGPSSRAMCAASRAVFGRRYLNRGRRSTQILGRRLDLDARRIWDVREAPRADASRLTFLFAAERLDDLLRRHRRLVYPYAERVVHRSVDRWDDRQQRALSGFLRPVWPFGIVGLDDERLHLRHVEEGGGLVLEHRRPLVQAFAKLLLLHQRLAQAHVHAALDLALDEQRVDGSSDVVCDPDLVDVHEPGARVGVEVHHAG